jgi:hypothetical protein
MNEQRFTKIKYDGSKVRLEYERPRKDDGDADEFLLNSADKPAPELDAALQALAVDVVTICELIPSDVSRLKVRGVTLTYTNEIQGAVITALKTLTTSHAPMVCNTPHLPSEPYSEGAGDYQPPTWPTGMFDRIAALEAQAKRYLDGERAQATLFADEAAPEPAGEPAHLEVTLR